MWPAKGIALTEPAVSKELSVGEGKDEFLNVISGEKHLTYSESSEI